MAISLSVRAQKPIRVVNALSKLRKSMDGLAPALSNSKVRIALNAASFDTELPW